MDRVVVKHIWVNLAGLVLPTFVSLATVPAYIRLLGAERYGVISLVWALIGYFSVLDFGMSLATENQIAKARGDAQAVTEIFWSAVWLNLATGIAGGAVLYGVAYGYTTQVLHLSAQYEREVLGALGWLALAIPIANLAWVFAGAITAAERFTAFNVNQTLGTFLFQLLPLGCAYLISPTLPVVLAAAVVARLLGALGLAWVTLRALGITAVAPPRRAVAGRLFGFGRWAALLSGTGMIVDTLDRVLVGSLLGARFVTFYTVPQNLVARLNLLPDAMLRTLFPRLSALPRTDATTMARNALAFLNGAFTPCVICALFLLAPFLTLWLGHALAAESVRVGQILLVAVWLSGQQSLLRILMLAQSSEARAALLGVLVAPCYALALYFGIAHYGILGASTVVLGRALVEYLLLLHFSRISISAVIGAMSVHGALILAALYEAMQLHPPSRSALAALAFVCGSIAWSLWTSPRLRQIARHPVLAAFPTMRREPPPAE
ncbi:oligosaccharide flippase family protein [Chitinasiproducens palmae]|uniref:Membrane protein involved in the export of O-antigen and teichoic acid n=1 Tax=Chitinasiproducens palmae TaxID=1770053 RepID=A0A1H2PTT3_9BURK|nr:oligosaccharide flippase family protein [Chitinasiproducens palmae]SDV50543.1 Membrane protein involved in the export of O-antigen and teichoic acid [Chitinasiproducens palmae]